MIQGGVCYEKKIDYKDIENSLKNYRYYEVKIKELELRIDDLKDIQYLNQNNMNYKKENILLYNQESEEFINSNINKKILLFEYNKRRLERAVQRIDNALNWLTNIEKDIVQKKYINNKTWKCITYEVNIEERQCREIRNKALSKLRDILLH